MSEDERMNEHETKPFRPVPEIVLTRSPRAVGPRAGQASKGSEARVVSLEGEKQVRTRLVALRQKHRDLDDSIMALERAGTFDQLQVRRLKREKLNLKDDIRKLQAMLHPDIIA